MPNIVWITSEDNSKHYLKLFDANGVQTPNIESLAAQGIVFSHAFSNAPVCSVARSALISGSYGPRIGSQYHRKMRIVPMPDSLKMFPAYLRQAGYYTTNNRKEDYNLIKGEDVWDASSADANWKNRREGQPFFHVFNIGVSHESGLHFTEEEMHANAAITDENSFTVQPNHPQTKIFTYTNALYRDKIVEMDRQLGEVIKALENDGLLDNTFIFYFGDHGGVLPGSKGYLYETGLHVPLVLRIPENFKHLVDVQTGSTFEGFVSFVDLGPTALNLAGVEIPDGMDGIPFLGQNISTDSVKKRDETYSYADRFDEKIDLVRAIRKGRFKYIRNYQPFNYDGLMNNYRYKQLAYKEWQAMYEKGMLDEAQSAFFRRRTPEMLFDIERDPYETNNLAEDALFKSTLIDLRGRLNRWVSEMPDLSFYPEHYLIENAFHNPVAFGQQHKEEIGRYIDIANLSLLPFDAAESQLVQSLTSVDPWERYWALIVCSIFGEKANVLEAVVHQIALDDPETINKVRAAEYLGIVRSRDPSEVMIRALYQSKSPSEALLILNSVVLMQSATYNYSFEIQLKNIAEIVREDAEVGRRLTYLGLL